MSRLFAYALVALVAGAELVVLGLALRPDVEAAYRAYFVDRTTTCLDRQVDATYALGETVSFLPDGAAAAGKLRVCGWQGPVGDGTHSIGHSSLLRLRVGPPQPLVARLELRAAVAKPQRVVVLANGVALGTVALPDRDARQASFAIPRAALSPSGLLDLRFDFPDAVSPGKQTSEIFDRSIKLLAVTVEPAA